MENMVRTDWNRILSVNVSRLTDEEIENLCPMVMRCNVNEISDFDNLQTLMKVSQEMLQYKDNQVESLLSECNDLKESTSLLQTETSKSSRNEVLTETNLEDRVIKKRPDLSKNLICRDVPQSRVDKVATLMGELESLDKENNVLKERLTELKEEMVDATERMNEMTRELTVSRMRGIEYDEKILKLEQENIALITQIEELTAQQVERDKMIDEFGMAIDARISEWKVILDGRDAEIERLNENLSRSLMHSITKSVNEQTKSKIAHLNEEIYRRDKIIVELQARLSEAVIEINDSSSLIEQLKSNTMNVARADGRKKDQSDLLRKMNDANVKIFKLERDLVQAHDEVALKSSQLCQILSTLRKYQDENKGLTEALREVKELKIELDRKNKHIEDIVVVVNRLEASNSHQELEIATLREKLGIPEDKCVSVSEAAAKRKKQLTKIDELIENNKNLLEENLEMKSDIRVLKYKLYKSLKSFNSLNRNVEGDMELLHYTKVEPGQDWVLDAEHEAAYRKEDVDLLKENVRMVIEENEALRTGMHEILDSIRSQDGKSSVEVYSSTLERLLEALDVRHLAGWYHPAMRLQERLNVVQGTNTELRSQLKQLRKELQRKDGILQDLVVARGKGAVERVDLEDSEYEKEASYSSDLGKLHNACDKSDVEGWSKREEELTGQLNEMKDTIDALKVKLDCYERDWRIIESGEETIVKEFAIKSREYAEATAEVLLTNRKVSALRALLCEETGNAYQRQKEAINRECRMKQALADSGKHIKMLENEVATHQSNLLNSVSLVEYEELKEKYEETCIHLRASLDVKLMMMSREGEESSNAEVITNTVERDVEKFEWMDGEWTQGEARLSDRDDDDMMTRRYQDAMAKELLERRRADHMTRLHEISQGQVRKCEANVRDLISLNSELQERIVDLHKRLSAEMIGSRRDRSANDDGGVRGLQTENESLKMQNENLKRHLEISRDEARMYYALNSFKSLELDNLRHTVVDLQAISEDKAIISRLDFELTRRKVSEMELNASKIQLENEVQRLEEELEKAKQQYEKMRLGIHDCRKQCEDRCRTYTDVISFMQRQYAACASASSLERIIAVIERLRNDRENVTAELNEAKKCHANAKLQRELLSNRLEIVDRLKDILEQRIGDEKVEEMMRDFSDRSQKTVNDFRYKRRIAYLEYELQIANDKCVERDSVISTMENEMLNVQRAWGQRWLDVDRQIPERKLISVERNTMAIQVTTEVRSKQVQTDAYTCCLSRSDDVDAVSRDDSNNGSALREEVVRKRRVKENVAGSSMRRIRREEEEEKEEEEEEEEEVKNKDDKDDKDDGDSEKMLGTLEEVDEPMTAVHQEGVTFEIQTRPKSQKKIAHNGATDENENSVALLNDQLSEALKLASERSVTTMRYESQIAEYRVTLNTLRKALTEKDSLLAEKGNGVERNKLEQDVSSVVAVTAGVDGSDKQALKSTVQSLQRMIAQKEDTILRYQTLLKEDRDEHSRAAAYLQEEIKILHGRILAMQEEAKKRCCNGDENRANSAALTLRENVVQQDVIARLREEVSTLEADLSVTKELSDRWHRLAEERLRHVDRMRESLEEQHKNELECYRSEIDKWQSEANGLRQRLSENRVTLTKGNVSLMKELQEREEKIHELSLACQQLQNEVELIESAAHRSHHVAVAQNERAAKKMSEVVCGAANHEHHSPQQQSDLLAVRRQVQSFVDREKLYKREIAELKERLSRGYMATKAQKKRTSQREALLERKVKSLEEELQKAQAQLDREYLAQEAKKTKTAQDLSLWEKQKMWQQTAEKLRERLKEKSNECDKLRANYERLRSVVVCMERENRNLRSKLKGECRCRLTARPMSAGHNSLVDDLRKESQTLRERLSELTDRLEREDSGRLLRTIDEQKRRIDALESVTSQGNSHASTLNQLERLEATTDSLEKKNLNLESENFQLRLEIEKANSDTPGLREKVEHLERYVELLKIEKSSDSTPRSSDKGSGGLGTRKSLSDMERTIFTLKRVVEKLQAENKRLRMSAKKSFLINNQGRTTCSEVSESSALRGQYEQARKRIVALEMDLQLAEQRTYMLERAQGEDDDGELNGLKQQLVHKSELLDKMKQLLTRAAINEKSLRQRVQQLETTRTLSVIPECYVTPSTSE